MNKHPHSLPTPIGVGSDGLVGRLERRVRYYERMHADARRALDIASSMSAEMKERLIEARQELARAKSPNKTGEQRAHEKP